MAEGPASEIPACFDYRPGWVTAADATFSRLREELSWEQHDITVYGRTVPTPG